MHGIARVRLEVAEVAAFVNRSGCSGRGLPMWGSQPMRPPAGQPAPVLDVARIREHFCFPAVGRVVTNNAASTQPPRELLELHRSLAPWYENVHRGQSSASQHTTALFEESYDTI